jgi:hypothetical protein
MPAIPLCASRNFVESRMAFDYQLRLEKVMHKAPKFPNTKMGVGWNPNPSFSGPGNSDWEQWWREAQTNRRVGQEGFPEEPKISDPLANHPWLPNPPDPRL